MPEKRGRVGQGYRYPKGRLNAGRLLDRIDLFSDDTTEAPTMEEENIAPPEIEPYSASPTKSIPSTVTAVEPPALGEKPGFFSNLFSKGQTGTDYRRAQMQAELLKYKLGGQEALNNQAMSARSLLQQDRLAAENALVDRQLQAALERSKAEEAFKRGVLPEMFNTSVVPVSQAELANKMLETNFQNSMLNSPDFLTARARGMYDMAEKQKFENRLAQSNAEKNMAAAEFQRAEIPKAPYLNIAPGSYAFNTATGLGTYNREAQQYPPAIQGGPMDVTAEGNILGIRPKATSAAPAMPAAPSQPLFSFPEQARPNNLPPEYAPYADKISPSMLGAPTVPQGPKKPYPMNPVAPLTPEEQTLQWLLKNRSLPAPTIY